MQVIDCNREPMWITQTSYHSFRLKMSPIWRATIYVRMYVEARHEVNIQHLYKYFFSQCIWMWTSACINQLCLSWARKMSAENSIYSWRELRSFRLPAWKNLFLVDLSSVLRNTPNLFIIGQETHVHIALIQILYEINITVENSNTSSAQIWIGQNGKQKLCGEW